MGLSDSRPPPAERGRPKARRGSTRPAHYSFSPGGKEGRSGNLSQRPPGPAWPLGQAGPQRELAFLLETADKEPRVLPHPEKFPGLVGPPKSARPGTPQPGGLGCKRISTTICKSLRRGLKPSSFRDYNSILRKHLSGFCSFEELNQGLEAYLSGLEVSGKRRNNILTAARSFLGWGLRRNRWDGPLLQVPRFKVRSKKIMPLTPA